MIEPGCCLNFFLKVAEKTKEPSCTKDEVIAIPQKSGNDAMKIDAGIETYNLETNHI